MRFAGDSKFALVDTLFSVPKGCTSCSSNGTRPADSKRLDFIFMRQPHGKLVRNVNVYLQTRTDSDQDVVCATVQLPCRFAGNRKRRVHTGCKSIDRQAITTDTDRRLRRPNSGAKLVKKRQFSLRPSCGLQRRCCQAKSNSPVYLGCFSIRQCALRLKKLDIEGRESVGGARRLGHRLCFSRISEGMQKTQGDHTGHRGLVHGGVCLSTRGVYQSWGHERMVGASQRRVEVEV